MIIDLDASKKLIKPKLMLAKPNREIISPIPEFYNGKQNIKLGKVNELSFNIPIEIDQNHKLIRNKNVDLIKEKFLIKFTKGTNYTEWYIVDKITRDMDDDKEYMSYQCFSLSYELSRKHIKDYSVVSKTATEVLTVALDETIWSIDFMAAEFDLKFRAFDVTTKSVLDFVFEIAEKYNALIVWDTVNRQISFYDLDAIGSNKGLKVKYGKLLNNIKYEENTDEIATRLKIFGRDGISINKLQPTGVNYLENYNHYLFPFSRDEFGVVIASSDYFSDSLSSSLLDYEELVESKQGEFDTLLSDLTTLEDTLTIKENELFTLETELEIIEDDLATANANGTDNTLILADKSAKETEISDKKTEISTVETDIAAKQAEINTLKDSVAIENNFTIAELEEWNPFIITRSWHNDNYTDEEQLYEAGKEEFEKIRSPKIIAEIGIVNLLELIEEQKNWDKLNIGDTVVIEHEKLEIDVTAKMMEFNFDYESGSVSVVIANVKEIMNDKEKFMQEHYNSVSSSTVFSQSKIKYDDAKATVDAVSQTINSTYDANEREIQASSENEVEISRKGIRIYDINDPLKVVILQRGIIALSNDGGNNWSTAATASGVIAERLIGQIILGNQLNISDDDGMFTIVGNLLTVKDPTDVVRVMLGEYTTGKYGLQLFNKTGDSVVLDEDGIIQTDTIQEADNVDSTHALKLKFYIDDGVISIRNIKLNFSLEAFRAYSTGASSGGGSTSGSGGGSTNYYLSSGGLNFGSYSFDYSPVKSNGSHSHGNTGSAGSHSHTSPNHLHAFWDTDTWMDGTNKSASDNTLNASVTIDSGGDHYHATSSGGHHEHAIYDFYLTTPNHTHSVPSHTHGISYGIFESASSATGVTIKVDGLTRDSTGYTTDQANLDLTTWITTSGWHTIELTSTTLGRINASLYLKSFVGV